MSVTCVSSVRIAGDLFAGELIEYWRLHLFFECVYMSIVINAPLTAVIDAAG